MLWISRPPYLRWLVASAIVVLTMWIELRPQSTSLHPYLTTDVARGAAVTEVVEWRTIASGALPTVTGDGYANHLLTAGDPLLPSDTSLDRFVTPEGWWVVELELPADAEIGSSIQLVILPEVGLPAASPIPGYVVTIGSHGDRFGAAGQPGSVAFAPAFAATAAVAIANNRVSVLIQTPQDDAK